MPVRKDEAARERAFHQLDARNGISHDLAESLDFPFRLEINDDAKFSRAPISQPRGKLGAFCLQQNEIAHREIADVALLERAPKIFRLIASQPAFSDQDIAVTG